MILQHGRAWELESKGPKGVEISYLDWDSSIKASSLQGNRYVQEQLGDIWMIPDDGRLPLRFSRNILEELSPQLLQVRSRELADFGSQMTKGSAFKIIDDCTQLRGSQQARVTYRIGRKADFYGMCMVQARDDKSHIKINDRPWRRLM